MEDDGATGSEEASGSDLDTAVPHAEVPTGTGRLAMQGEMAVVEEEPGDEATLMMTTGGGRKPDPPPGRGGDSGGRKGDRPRPKPENKEEAGSVAKKARPKPQSTTTAFTAKGRVTTGGGTGSGASSSRAAAVRPPALPDMVEVAVDSTDGEVGSRTGAVMTDTAEESVARWRQILGMEDGGVVRSGEAFSDTQQNIIRDQYQALPPAERLLFCMGLNAFLSTVLMDATMCIRDVELSHLQNGSSDEETRREEPDETAMMQRQWVSREGRTGANPQQLCLSDGVKVDGHDRRHLVSGSPLRSAYRDPPQPEPWHRQVHAGGFQRRWRRQQGPTLPSPASAEAGSTTSATSLGHPRPTPTGGRHHAPSGEHRAPLPSPQVPYHSSGLTIASSFAHWPHVFHWAAAQGPTQRFATSSRSRPASRQRLGGLRQ